MPARNDIERHLSEGTLLPIYALVGPEPTLQRETRTQIAALTLTAAPDFNCDRFQGGKSSLSDILSAANTLPMMADKRLVVVNDCHRYKVKELEPLLNYIDNPNLSTTLCLAFNNLTLTTKIAKRLMKERALFSIVAPKQKGLGGWITRRASHKGYVIEADATELLADLIGPDVGHIDRSLETLSLYCAAESGEISYQAVEKIIAPTRVESIFELVDAIGQKDLARSSALMRNLLRGGEAGLKILAMVSRQFRLLLKAKGLHLQGASSQDIARAIRVPPFLVDSIIKQTARYSGPELCAALAASGKADFALKSSKLSDGAVLEQLLMDVVKS